MKQYLDIGRRIINEGVWVENKRTNKRCLTLVNVTMEYDVGAGIFPMITTRKAYYKSAIAELLGYLRGYDSAADFRAIGAKTWDANANVNTAWLANPHRKGVDDMGRVYGVQGRHWQKPDGSELDQLAKIVNNLSNGIDDRGEILMFWNPGEFEYGCLRPCMYSHQFSLVGDTLHLTSTQRSSDWMLGTASNSIQCYVLLALIAQITGHKPGKVLHINVNAHIYEDQFDLFKDVQLNRDPFPSPTLWINPEIRSLADLETWVTTDDFKVENYASHLPIAYPFSV